MNYYFNTKDFLENKIQELTTFIDRERGKLMETYEIDLLDLLKMINDKKVFILGLVCISIIIVFIVSAFFIEEQYQSEIWIKLNENFLYDQKDIPFDYLKTYFKNSDVVQFAFNDDAIILGGLSKNFSLKEVKGMINIEFTHLFRSDISEKLMRWMNATRVNLILDERQRVISKIENEVLANQIKLENLQSNFTNINDVLKKEGQYVFIEVAPRDADDPQVFTFRELNPNYTGIKAKANQIELEIKTLKTQNELLQNILTNYKAVLVKLSQMIESNNVIESDVFENLKQIQTNYLTYLKQNGQSGTYGSFIPFEIISEPHTTPNPISPNVKLNVVLAGFLALFIAIFVVFFMNYFETIKQEKQTQKM